VAEAISFIPTDEQTMLKTTLAEFLEAKIDYDQVREMSTGTSALDRDVWAGIAEMGLIGLHIPESYGGGGYSMREVAVVFEQLGRFVAAVPLLSTVMASTAILAGGTEQQRQEMLPPIASGERIATLAAFESAHGLSPDSMETTVTARGEGYVLSGVKRYVTDAVNAAVFVVAAKHGDSTALVVVDAGASGVSVTPTNALDATRPLGEVAFIDVEVGADAVIVDGAHALQRAVDVGVVCLSAEQVGGAQWCLDTSVEYAKNRYQFGRAIGSFQAIKHRCADMLVATEHARSAAWYAAATIDDPDEAGISVPLARSVCSDAFVKASGDTIQILGGIGFTWEHEAHLYFKRAKSSALLLGSVGSYRDRLADAAGF
jgi:alkylation response protein AidB-like acyl-CoA dehydrogenase